MNPPAGGYRYRLRRVGGPTVASGRARGATLRLNVPESAGEGLYTLRCREAPSGRRRSHGVRRRSRSAVGQAQETCWSSSPRSPGRRPESGRHRRRRLSRSLPAAPAGKQRVAAARFLAAGEFRAVSPRARARCRVSRRGRSRGLASARPRTPRSPPTPRPRSTTSRSSLHRRRALDHRAARRRADARSSSAGARSRSSRRTPSAAPSRSATELVTVRPTIASATSSASRSRTSPRHPHR